jgi:prepilin-type N-terminal cleavage/methylation domain-containing protein
VETEERRGTGGFTLLELIVTLIVLTVILAAVSPVFIYSLRHNREDQSIQDFVAYLKYAQECAVARSVEYRVYLNHDERRFWVMHFARTKNGALKLVDAEEPFAGKRVFPEGVRIDKPKAREDEELNANYIAFYPNGACDFASVKIRYGRHGRFQIKTEGNLGVFVSKDKTDS